MHSEDGQLQDRKKAPTRNVLFCGSQLPHMRTLRSPEEPCSHGAEKAFPPTASTNLPTVCMRYSIPGQAFGWLQPSQHLTATSEKTLPSHSWILDLIIEDYFHFMALSFGVIYSAVPTGILILDFPEIREINVNCLRLPVHGISL